MTKNAIVYQQENGSATVGDVSLYVKRLSPTGYDVAATMLIAIAAVGIFNNLCVLILMIKDRHLRTSVNMMLLNLSISDLIIATLGAPLAAGAALSHQWIYGQNVCVAYAFGMAISGVASISSLAVLSFQRCRLVLQTGTIPISGKKFIIFVWIYAFLVTFPPFIGWNEFKVERSQIACTPNWESTNLQNTSYIIYLFIFGLLIPLTIMLVSYINIIRKVSTQSRRTAGLPGAKGQVRIARMVLVMIMAFLIAWMPYASVSLIVAFCGENAISASAGAAPAIFAKSACICNPVIYFFMNTEIKAAFIKWITCGKLALFSVTDGKDANKKGEGLKTGDATFRHSESEMVSQNAKDSNSSQMSLKEVELNLLPTAANNVLKVALPHFTDTRTNCTSL